VGKDDASVFMQPTILTDLKPNMLAYQENFIRKESFTE
jgi:hypothetical protein